MPEPLPPIDYSSRDYASIRADLIAAKRQRVPNWTSESPNDLGIVLIELFAYVGDMLSFYADRVANEAYLDTAVLRSSVYALARMLDYRPTGLTSATTTLQFTTGAAAGPVTIPAGTRVQTAATPGTTPVVFETNAELTIVGGAGSHTGTVAATQGVTISNEVVGVSDGDVYQRYALFQSPVVDRSTVVTINGAVWMFYDHIIDAGPNDLAYTSYTDEGGITYLEFGDDVNGRVPDAGSSITVTYRIGDGSAGNLAVGTIKELTSALVVLGVVQPIESVSNSTMAIGGADPETIDSIRQNAPRALTAVNRAVTLEDFAALSRRISGVGKARAVSTSATAVTIYVAPTGLPGGTVPTQTKTAVTNYLEPRKMIGITVTLADPTYVLIDVTATVHVLPTYRRQTVIDAVAASIRSVLNYDNVDFEERVSLSSIYQAVNSTEGVVYGNITKLDNAPGTDVADVVLAANAIPIAGTISVGGTGGIT